MNPYNKFLQNEILLNLFSTMNPHKSNLLSYHNCEEKDKTNKKIFKLFNAIFAIFFLN